MASNDDNGSTNPASKNTKKEKITDNTGSTAASTNAARLGRDSTAGMVPQNSIAVAPTGKRRRSSEANEPRIDFTGQTDSSHSDVAGANVFVETGTNAAAGTNAAGLSLYQGNGMLFVTKVYF